MLFMATVTAVLPGLRVSEIISALSYALDLTEGRLPGHSVRSCIIGMRLAEKVGLSIPSRGDLFYALLLKDAGCSSNSSKLFHLLAADEIRAKADVKLTDWTRVGWESLQYAIGHVATGAPFLERIGRLVHIAGQQQKQSANLVKIRCERGASVARQMGFGEPVAQGIHSLDEHWNGDGYPDGLRGDAIPMYSRIMNIAQTLDVFHSHRSAAEAIAVVRQRSKSWFDPNLVKAAESLAKNGELWRGLNEHTTIEHALALEPEERRLTAGDDTISNICDAFAEIIDAKSPFTYRHSNGVADAAVAICGQLAMSPEETKFVRRAALLHDVGKLSVSNTILEKPGPLDSTEWGVVKQHPYYTLEILRRIPGFGDLSDIAAAHHEKLDGSGYFRHWGAAEMSLHSRILVVADIYDALAAKRPYREAMPLEKVFAIMDKDSPHSLDAECVGALKLATLSPPTMSDSLISLARHVKTPLEVTSDAESHVALSPAA